MDKIGILRDLSNSNCFPLLMNSELKLYILLLVNSTDIEVSERIELEQLERANGKSLTFAELKPMMASLQKYGLAVIDGVIEGSDGKCNEMRFRLKRPVPYNKQR